jgi:hypothetical protein
MQVNYCVVDGAGTGCAIYGGSCTEADMLSLDDAKTVYTITPQKLSGIQKGQMLTWYASISPKYTRFRNQIGAVGYTPKYNIDTLAFNPIIKTVEHTFDEVGTYTVEVMLEDNNGDVSTETYQVEVVEPEAGDGTTGDDTGDDTGDGTPITEVIAPIVYVPSDILITDADTSGELVPFAVSAIDNVDGALIPACSPGSDYNFPIGTTTVTCTATDAAGNKGTNSFTITLTVATEGDDTTATCGNNIIEGSEECDGTASFTQTCESVLGGSSYSGSLTCSSTCEFDTSTCIAPPLAPPTALSIINDEANNQCRLDVTLETDKDNVLIILQIKDGNGRTVAYEYQTRSMEAGVTQTLTIDKPSTSNSCEGFLWEDWSGTPLANNEEIDA